MKGNFRRSMAWLHTYSGLWLGWLLFVVFVTGTLSYYADEIDNWMQPEKLLAPQHPQVISHAMAALNQKEKGANSWTINLNGERNPKAEIRWNYPGKSRKEAHSETLSSPEHALRDTLGGRFFVHFHYSLELREYGGRYFTGIAAFMMLVGVFSGIFTHRRFFKDFFVLRWQKLSRAMTDVHAIIGIITIPFCFVICFSALLFYLSLYVPASASYHYDKGYRQLSSQVSPKRFSQEPSGVAAQPLTELNTILTQVKTKWPEANAISRISYHHPFDQQGYLVFYRNKTTLSRQMESITFDAATKQIIHQVEQPRLPKLINFVFLGLHEAKFADNSLRFILFILGALSCALIATGTLLWLNNRLERNVNHRGTQLVDWSNRAVLGGLPIAIISLFLSNRLLPTTLGARSEYELMCFLLAWGGCILLVTCMNKQRFWPVMLNSLAVGCFALPIIDLLLAPHYLVVAINQRNLTFISIEVAFIVTGIVALTLSRYINNRRKLSTQQRATT